MGADLPKDPEFVPVLPDHRAADRAWYERHGFMPINHIVMVRADMAEKAPEAVRAAYGLIERALARPQSPAGEPRQTLVGIEAVRAPLAFIIEEMRRQELLPSMIDVDALLEPARRLLGA
jgi:4,5-dihydroxyphthalate decarboxylase